MPQRLLSDNGLALNPSRRGIVGQLVAHVAALGTEASTGKPYKPTTQGKNERFHQTLFRYLDKQPPRRVARRTPGPSRRVRPHLQHPAPAPRATRTRHTPDRVESGPQGRGAAPETRPAHLRGTRSQLTSPAEAARRPPADTRIRTVATTGTITPDSVFYKIDVNRAFEQVLVISNGNQAGDKIIITDLEGEILAEHTRPAPGTRYVGNGRRPGTRPKYPGASPKS